MKCFTFETGIYEATINVYFSESFDELEKIHSLGDCSDFDGICFRGCIDDKETYNIAFIKKHFNFSKLSHEVTHLVNMIFQDRCIELDLVNDEPQAYLHDYIVKQVEVFVIDNLKLYTKNVYMFQR